MRATDMVDPFQSMQQIRKILNAMLRIAREGVGMKRFTPTHTYNKTMQQAEIAFLRPIKNAKIIFFRLGHGLR